MIPEPIFLCNVNPHHLISTFITALEGLATQSKAQMKVNFNEIETAIKIKLCAILEQLTQRRNQAERVSNFVDDCIVEKEEKDLSTQFLQKQKNQLFDLQEHFERYCNVLPVFGFNSAKYDINLIKSYLLPILVNDRGIQPTVIKKASSLFLSSLETFNYWTLWISSVVPRVLTFSSKLTRPKRQRVSFPTNGSIVQRKWTTKNFLRMTPSLAFCATAAPLKKITTTFKTLSTVVKRQSRHWSSYEWIEYLRQVLKFIRIWKASGRIITCNFFSDFLKWYNNKDVVPTLKAMQKMIEFEHNKGIDLLKLGCTLPNLANICLHKSTE